MKKNVWQSGLKVLFLLVISVTTHSQPNKQGKVLVQKFLAPSIQNNKGGEDANRRLTIYLPPEYDKSNQRYPTIYFLHGFASDDFVSAGFSLMNFICLPELSAKPRCKTMLQ